LQQLHFYVFKSSLRIEPEFIKVRVSIADKSKESIYKIMTKQYFIFCIKFLYGV